MVLLASAQGIPEPRPADMQAACQQARAQVQVSNCHALSLHISPTSLARSEQGLTLWPPMWEHMRTCTLPCSPRLATCCSRAAHRGGPSTPHRLSLEP